MKTFNDLVFGERFRGGIGARLDFDNGFSISVVAGKYAYCTPREDNSDPDFFSDFEVAVFAPNGDWATRDFLPESKDDVLGWRSRAEINSLMLLIQRK